MKRRTALVNGVVVDEAAPFTRKDFEMVLEINTRRRARNKRKAAARRAKR